MRHIVAAGCLIAALALPSTGAEAQTKLWGDIDYEGKPWVENVSLPNKISHGLKNRHIALWASHGRYYDKAKGGWKW